MIPSFLWLKSYRLPLFPVKKGSQALCANSYKSELNLQANLSINYPCTIDRYNQNM